MVGRGTLAELPDSVKDLNELGVRDDGEHTFLVLMKALGYEQQRPKQRNRQSTLSGNERYLTEPRQTLASQL